MSLEAIKITRLILAGVEEEEEEESDEVKILEATGKPRSSASGEGEESDKDEVEILEETAFRSGLFGGTLV